MREWRLGRLSVVTSRRRADMRTWFSVSPVLYGDTLTGVGVYGPRRGVIVMVDPKRAA